MASPDSLNHDQRTDGEFDIPSAEKAVIDLGNKAIEANLAVEFALSLGSLARQLARYDEEERGQRSSGYNPFKQSN